MSSRPAWAVALEASWWRPGQPAWPLRALARLFGGLSALRRTLHARGWLRSERLPVPVVVIGNRIVGGAGKTPVTLALIVALRQAGWQPGVVSRGHGSDRSDARAVSSGSTAAEVGDEPWLLARRAGVPVWVGHDRAATAARLLAAHPAVDVIVCDDGLQHLRLGRDLALVVFDERGAGNGWLLPAGPLREPLRAPSGARHEWVVYNAPAPTTPLAGTCVTRSLAGLVTLDDWWRPEPPPALRPVASLAGTDALVWAVAGIGAPQRFFGDLAAAGLPCHGVALADHDGYRTLPWPRDVAHVVVTEKDAAKLQPARIHAERPGTTVWVAPMQLALPAGLTNEVCAALASLRGSMPGWTRDSSNCSSAPSARDR